MTVPTYVRFSAPISLCMALPSRVSQGGRQTRNQTFSMLPMWVQIDAANRTITAYLSPVPAGLLLYGEADFSAACSDSMEDHAARALQLLGSDPSSSLQALIDGAGQPSMRPRVPREVAHWRMALALQQAGTLTAVGDLLASLPDPQGAVANAAWSGNSAVSRRSPLVLAVAAAIGYSPEDMDALFIAAEAIQA